MTTPVALPVWARPRDVMDLIRLAVPIVVTRSATMLMGITDSIVLGQIAPEELPFVANAWLPIGISLGLTMGLLVGVSVLTAELSGVGKSQDTGRVFRRGVYFSLWFGGLLTLLIVVSAPYLFRALSLPDAVVASSASATQILAYGLVGHMLTTAAGSYLEALRRPMVVTVIMYAGVLINLVWDLALVAGWWGMPQLGADGVALATTGTRWMLVVVFAIAIIVFTPGLKPSAPAPEDEHRRQFRVGYGMALSNAAEWGSFNFTFIIATWISLASGSIYFLATQVIGFTFMAFLGLGTATSVRVAEAYGRRSATEVRNASRLGVVTCLVVGSLLGALVWLFKAPIAAILVNAEAVVETVALQPLLAVLIGFAAFAVLFDGLQNVASMALRSQNIVWLPTCIHVGSYIALMLPLSYWLGITMERGVQGMMEAVIIGSFIAGSLQTLLLEWKGGRPIAPPLTVSE